MNKRRLCIFFFLTWAAISLPPMAAYAQKFTISKMGGTINGNILQVEGLDGRALKINYSFNRARKQMMLDGDPYFQPVHDEVLYSAAKKILVINRRVYNKRDNDLQLKSYSDKTTSILLDKIAGNAALANAINQFIQSAAQQSGVAAKKQKSLAIIQVDGKSLDEQVSQIETLFGH